MRIENISKVIDINVERNRILEEIKLVNNGKLGVTIQGKYQGEVIINRVAPIVLKFLYEELYYLENKLKNLGVEL